MKAFNTYISYIFLYNSEIWTLTINQENTINSFHRKILRKYVLNVKWPNIMNNENVYTATGTKLWCETIKTRWFGHVTRLPEDTPVKKALVYPKEN